MGVLRAVACALLTVVCFGTPALAAPKPVRPHCVVLHDTHQPTAAANGGNVTVTVPRLRCDRATGGVVQGSSGGAATGSSRLPFTGFDVQRWAVAGVAFLLLGALLLGLVRGRYGRARAGHVSGGVAQVVR